MTRVKIVFDLLGPCHADVFGQIGIASKYPGTTVTSRSGLDVNDLVVRVDLSIGTPCTTGLDFVIRDFRKRLFNTALNGPNARLQLPTAVMRAVVFKS